MGNKIKYIVILVISFLVGYFVVNIVNTKNNDFTKIRIQNNSYLDKSNYSIELDSVSLIDLYSNFPYDSFVQRVNYADLDAIAIYFNDIERLCNSNFIAQNVLSKALTTELEPKIKTSNIDSLKAILDFADSYNRASFLDKKNKDFYQSVYDYWYNYVTNSISLQIKKDAGKKYTFKNRYLIQRCEDNGYSVDKGNSNFEKVVLYVIDNKWAYLFNRLWNGTSFFIKLLLAVVMSGVILLMIFGIKYIIIKKQNK